MIAFCNEVLSQLGRGCAGQLLSQYCERRRACTILSEQGDYFTEERPKIINGCLQVRSLPFDAVSKVSQNIDYSEDLAAGIGIAHALAGTVEGFNDFSKEPLKRIYHKFSDE